MIFSFTHTQEMPLMLPGVSPTVAIVKFRDGKLAPEYTYGDQASLLTAVTQTLLISSTAITPHAPTFASYSDCCLLAIYRATGLPVAIESFALLCQELPDLPQRNP